MRTNKSSQNQKSGGNSGNIQAGRDVNLNLNVDKNQGDKPRIRIATDEEVIIYNPKLKNLVDTLRANSGLKRSVILIVTIILLLIVSSLGTLFIL